MSQVFAFQSRQIRTVTENAETWFVAKDICAALGIGWSGTSLNGIPEAWQGMWRDHIPRSQRMKIISEPAVYKLAFRSNKPESVNKELETAALLFEAFVEAEKVLRA